MLCCRSKRNRQMESASELVRIIFMRGRQKTQRICLPLFAKNNDWHSHHHEAWSLFGIHYSSSGSSISQKSHRMNTQITILLFEYSNYIITTWLLPNVVVFWRNGYVVVILTILYVHSRPKDRKLCNNHFRKFVWILLFLQMKKITYL